MREIEQILKFHSSKEMTGVFVYESIVEKTSSFDSKEKHQRSVVTEIFSELLNSDVTICHWESGAPFIANFSHKNISISHSKNFYAIQLCDSKKVGLDIQVYKKNLFKGKSYFVNKEEESDIEMSELNLHLIWSAKEALYKLLEGKILNFKEAIKVIEIGDSKIWAEVNNKNYELYFHTNTEFVLVYS